MWGTVACLAGAALGAEVNGGIQFGYQPLPGGGMQYIVQMDPEYADSIRSRYAAESDVPPEVKDVRRFQIRIAKGGSLPHELPPAQAAPVEKQPQKSPPKDVPEDQRKGTSNPTNAAPQPNRFTPAERTGPETGKPKWMLQGGEAAPAAADPPHTLPPESGTKPAADKAKPIERPGPFDQAKQATFVHGTERPSLPATSGDQSKGKESEKPKPWLPLTLTLAGLFGSVSGNVYLGWLFLETRRRYRALLRRHRKETVRPRD